MKKYKSIIVIALLLISQIYSFAQTAGVKNTIYVNKDITTFILSGEDIKMIDLSCKIDSVVGNQPNGNICRIKPLKEFVNYTHLGILTIIGERNISQLNIVYTSDKNEATTDYKILQEDMESYINPAVNMTSEDMYKTCWKIIQSKSKYYDVSAIGNKLKIKLNNLYTVGNYFFFDISIDNNSNIKFDIDEIRTKLCDKKQSKATSTQELEIKPVMAFRVTNSFKKHYRNIFVLEKLTFPDEKVLTFSFSEKPISGRTITLRVDYADVLNADIYHE